MLVSVRSGRGRASLTNLITLAIHGSIFDSTSYVLPCSMLSMTACTVVPFAAARVTFRGGAPLSHAILSSSVAMLIHACCSLTAVSAVSLAYQYISAGFGSAPVTFVTDRYT